MNKGERIKALRLDSGMTQEELGEKIGAIKQTINKYENGTITNIPTDKIETMAEIFNVSESYIMGWEDSKVTISTDLFDNTSLKVLFSIAEDLSPEDIEFLTNMAKRMKGE